MTSIYNKSAQEDLLDKTVVVVEFTRASQHQLQSHLGRSPKQTQSLSPPRLSSFAARNCSLDSAPERRISFPVDEIYVGSDVHPTRRPRPRPRRRVLLEVERLPLLLLLGLPVAAAAAACSLGVTVASLSLLLLLLLLLLLSTSPFATKRKMLWRRGGQLLAALSCLAAISAVPPAHASNAYTAYYLNRFSNSSQE